MKAQNKKNSWHSTFSSGFYYKSRLYFCNLKMVLLFCSHPLPLTFTDFFFFMTVMSSLDKLLAMLTIVCLNCSSLCHNCKIGMYFAN